MDDAEVLALHRAIVAIPSPSHEEQRLGDHLAGWLGARGLEVERVGDNLVCGVGAGALVCLNSHLDTVPPSPAWTRPPFSPTVEAGRVYGLGANDAKAAVAAMIAATVRLARQGGVPGLRLLLALVVDEETGGRGTEVLVPELARRGLRPEAVIVGEPTGLDVAVAQKGLLVLELCTTGHACHAAHGQALGAANALRGLARDLHALDAVDLGPVHPTLGPTTLEPTLAAGGTARNVIPAAASCFLDLRTNPLPGHDELVRRLQAAATGEVRVHSRRLLPCAIDPAHPLVQAALDARPGARLLGSRGVSDWVFFDGIPGVKVGPGQSERSHTPDEFVLEAEILEGARFYEALVRAYAARRAGEVAA